LNYKLQVKYYTEVILSIVEIFSLGVIYSTV